MPPNVRSIVQQARARLRRQALPQRFRQHVSVHISTVSGKRRTVVQVTDHSIPDFRTRSPQASLRITQRDQFLASWLFDDRAVTKIASAAGDKGRRLYCLDTRDVAFPVLAALSFHVDAVLTRPLQITAIAIRLGQDDAMARSHVGAWYLTQYVQAAAEKLGRPDYLEMFPGASGAVDLENLGFEEVPRPNYGQVGRRAFRQRRETG